MTETKTHQAKSWLENVKKLLSREPKNTEQLLELLRDAEQRNLLDIDTLSILEGALRFSELQVRDIMIPRNQIITASIDSSSEDLIALVKQYGHSRYPVIGENRDEIVGILHAKDLLHVKTSEKGFSLSEMLRPASIVPESKYLNILLREFRNNRNHMAIVVDEYGGVCGFVTIEDLLEQIVGNIEDEFDNDDDVPIRKHRDGRYIINAQVSTEELNNYFNFDLNHQVYETLGGVLVSAYGSMPKIGDVITVEGLKFKVLNADNRRIKLVEFIKEGEQ